MTVHCIACDLASGRLPLPGGVIHETEQWRVEHCIGPLGLGTLVLKPKRHVTRVPELTEGESIELSPLLRYAAAVVDQLLDPEQVYVCLWSHAGETPGHIHYLVQPITSEQVREHGAHGPKLQALMFERGQTPEQSAVEEFADRARGAFAAGRERNPPGTGAI